MAQSIRRPQVCVLRSAEPGSKAYDLAADAGALMARLGITVVSGCGSPATRVAAERAVSALFCRRPAAADGQMICSRIRRMSVATRLSTRGAR